MGKAIYPPDVSLQRSRRQPPRLVQYEIWRAAGHRSSCDLDSISLGKFVGFLAVNSVMQRLLIRSNKHNRPSLGVSLLVVFAVVAASCSGGSSTADGGDENDEVAASAETSDDPSGEQESSDEQGASDDSDSKALEPGIPNPDFDYENYEYGLEAEASALRDDRFDPSFPPPIIDPALIKSGGPPPDAIPPIDEPVFDSVSDVDYLSDEEAVVAVTANGETRAYPVQVLIWHEIVNDDFDGTPVSVTYCPLCNSALAFDRNFNGDVLDFGTSGELYQSALVMYDRQTESLWAHFTGQGLVGHYAGAQLDFIPAQTVSFADYKQANPDGKVLNRETGFSRDYGTNPYSGYDFEDSDPIGGFFNGDVDRTLLAKARVVGIHDEAGSVAVCLADLETVKTLSLTEGGRNLVLFHEPGLASALQKSEIDGGRDIGQSAVFVAEAGDGTELSFTRSAEGFIDDQTNSTWDIFGLAVDGPLTGESLTSVPHLDTFWFAWATYRPGSVLIEVDSGSETLCTQISEES